MNDIEKKALALACEYAGRKLHHYARMGDDLPLKWSIVAHAGTILQHEAFKREVSDAVEAAAAVGSSWVKECLARFIIAKPVDPLVDVWLEAFPGYRVDDARDECAKISEALAKRGGKIVWENEQ